MFQNSWSIKLSEPPTHITTGHLPQPAFIFHGASKQLSVYTNNQTTPLPIRKQVLSLSSINNDQILLLTRFNLTCFDFLSNQERFSIQFENAQKMYVFNDKIYVSCGESIYCYDQNGQQDFVNHISNMIACLGKVEDQSGDIIVATTDATMCRYAKHNIVFDYAKIVGTATALCWVGRGVMVGTKQGTIAFYQGKKSKWKAKSTHSVSSILKYKSQDSQQIIILRQNGNVELRNWAEGTTICKAKAGQPIITGFIMDFRKQKFDQIICVLQSGQIKAFNLLQGGQAILNSQKSAVAQDLIAHQIDQLKSLRAELGYQIQKIKQSLKQKDNEENQQGPILTEDFVLKAVLQYQKGLCLRVSTQNGYISGLTFQQPIMPVLVERTQQLFYIFQQNNEVAGSITCQVMVHSSHGSNKYQVRSIQINLPKFWKWGLDSSNQKTTEGKLKCKIVQRNARFLKWAKQCFFINLPDKQQEKLAESPTMVLKFTNYYSGQVLQLVFSQHEKTVQIHCDCLKTIGQIVQDLVNYVGIQDLNTELYMPKQKQKIKQLLGTVERLTQTKVSISTQMADAINVIKFLLVKGQSARLVGSMNSFRKSFAELMSHNRNLLAQIEKKNMNTKILSDTMKSVGQFINQIANVRYGKSKTQVIAQCREAIKTKKFPQIIRLMDQGVQNDF